MIITIKINSGISFYILYEMFNECSIIAVKLIIQIREKGTRELHLRISFFALVADIHKTFGELQLFA